MLIATLDPADKVFGLKAPLFLVVCGIFTMKLLLDSAVMRKQGVVHSQLVIYVGIFALLLPLSSVALYLLRGGTTADYQGLAFMKSFMLLLMALILAYENENFLKPFVGVLLLLSAIMLGLFIYSVINPKFLAALWYVGDEYDFIVIGTRNYGPLSYKTIFYTTSPSLVIAAAFLSARAIVRVGMARWLSILGAVLVMFAMVISGTRNGIIMALITPCLAFYFFSRNRRAALALVLGISLLVALAAMPILSAMFDPKEGSNSIKLGYLADYASLFSSPTTFFLGQGLGATFYSVVKGKAVAITELTYLEFMRNFGVPLALLYFLMLVYPIRRLWQSQDQSRKSLALGYGLFLVSAAFNPIIVSSLGMLVLSIVLASAFENERQVDRREVQFSLQRARA